MAWIESHQSLLGHRKTGRLARRLGVGKITVIGHLHAFWWWCMDNAPDGCLAGIDAEDIADGACWEGDPAEFVDALTAAGFVDETTDGPAVHDWQEYGGKLLEKKTRNAVKQKEWRDRHVTKPDTPPQELPKADITVTLPLRNDTQYSTGQESTEEKNKTPLAPHGGKGEGAAETGKEPKKGQDALLFRFEQFWTAYPKKIGKGDALKWFQRQKPTPETCGLIITALEWQRVSAQWRKDGGQYVPFPATYLNRQGWLDEPDVDTSPPEPPPRVAPVRDHAADALAEMQMVEAALGNSRPTFAPSLRHSRTGVR